MAERRYDPEIAPIVPALPTEMDLSSAEALVPMRTAALLDLAGEPPKPRDDVEREERTIASREGDPDVRIRLYRPKAASSGLRAGFVEIHGGGFMVGHIDMADPFCDRVASEADAVVVNVDYRLAPENPFPAGIEDCYAALRWLADNADALGVDPNRIGIGGQSAGGGLSAGTALLARDRGGPALCFQLLEIPELDDRLETPSMQAFTDTPLWNRPNAVWSWRHYLGADHSGEVSPYAAPARATDLRGLPPAFVSTMEFDPLRDEGIQYALRMLQAGVPVELHSYPGTFHGSALVRDAAVSKRSVEDAMNAVRRGLA